MLVGVLWALFCPIAAAMAYLITYEEYRRHFPDRRRAIREGMATAAFTLVVFALLGGIVSVILRWVVT
jgi:hypothetical protein